MVEKDKRVVATNEILAGMKVSPKFRVSNKMCHCCMFYIYDTKFGINYLWIFQILKLYAWEPSFQQSVTEVRERELVHVRNINIINVLTYISWFLMPFLVSEKFVINSSQSFPIGY